MAPLQNTKAPKNMCENHRVWWPEIQTLVKVSASIAGAGRPLQSSQPPSLGLHVSAANADPSGSGERQQCPPALTERRKRGPTSAWLMAGAPCWLKPNPNFFFLRFYLFIFRERGREEGREERSINVWEIHRLVASCTLTEDLACNPGTCPEWESNGAGWGRGAFRFAGRRSIP